MTDTSRLRGVRSHLDWPFFEEAHRLFAARLDDWLAEGGLAGIDHGDTDAACRALVVRLGEAGSWSLAFRRLSGARRMSSTRACCAWPASDSPLPRVSRTSRSRCRGSAPAPSVSREAARCRSVCCPPWARAP